MRRLRPRGRTVASLAAATMVAAAVVRELSRPPADRNWCGTLLGVPYDFRAPTVERVRQRMWAPEQRQLLSPQVFGMGWTLNLGRLLALISTTGSRWAARRRAPRPEAPTGDEPA
jgi:hypothetical protein